MAQSHQNQTAAVAPKATRVYIPEPGVHVQTVSSDQYPGGHVYHLTHGFTDLPEEISKNQVLLNLVKSPEDTAEMEKQYETEKSRVEALAKAQADFDAATVALQDKQHEDLFKAEVARAKRVDEELAKGAIKAEDVLPVDPEARRAIALTADPMYGMVSAAGMATKFPPEVVYVPPAPLAGPPANRDVPYVSGDAVVGGILACTMGNWENEPTTYSYQWKSNDLNVSINSPNYNIGEGDAGHTIVCVVSATNILGTTVAPPSNAVVVPAGNGATTASAGPRRVVA